MIGFSPCGAWVDVIRQPYSRSCKFYPDQVVPTRIVWQLAQPGAVLLDLDTVFWPFTGIHELQNLADPGELTDHRFTVLPRNQWVSSFAGDHWDGTPAEYMGEGVTPQSCLIEGGKLPDVPQCLISPAMGFVGGINAFVVEEGAVWGFTADLVHFWTDLGGVAGSLGGYQRVAELPSALGFTGSYLDTPQLGGVAGSLAGYQVAAWPADVPGLYYSFVGHVGGYVPVPQLGGVAGGVAGYQPVPQLGGVAGGVGSYQVAAWPADVPGLYYSFAGDVGGYVPVPQIGGVAGDVGQILPVPTLGGVAGDVGAYQVAAWPDDVPGLYFSFVGQVGGYVPVPQLGGVAGDVGQVLPVPTLGGVAGDVGSVLIVRGVIPLSLSFAIDVRPMHQVFPARLGVRVGPAPVRQVIPARLGIRVDAKPVARFVQRVDLGVRLGPQPARPIFPALLRLRVGPAPVAPILAARLGIRLDAAPVRGPIPPVVLGLRVGPAPVQPVLPAVLGLRVGPAPAAPIYDARLGLGVDAGPARLDLVPVRLGVEVDTSPVSNLTPPFTLPCSTDGVSANLHILTPGNYSWIVPGWVVFGPGLISGAHVVSVSGVDVAIDTMPGVIGSGDYLFG